MLTDHLRSSSIVARESGDAEKGFPQSIMLRAHLR